MNQEITAEPMFPRDKVVVNVNDTLVDRKRTKAIDSDCNGALENQFSIFMSEQKCPFEVGEISSTILGARI